MLALLGLLTILGLLAVSMAGKMSTPVALIVVPVVLAVLGEFGF